MHPSPVRGKPSRALVAVRPVRAIHTAQIDADGADPTGADQHASTARKSASARHAAPIAHSAIPGDALQAAAAIALQGITGPVTNLQIEPTKSTQRS